jgi:diaminopimelate epimerase
MELLNADGGRAEMSGNGISCLVQAVRRAGIVATDTVTVATDAGPRTVTAAGDRMTVDMGPAKVVDEYDFGWFGLSLRHVARVDVGNPHLVLHVDTLKGVDLEAIGEWANKNTAGGTNVELCVEGDARHSIAMAVYERGVGLTEACGTGACAVAAAAVHWDVADSPVTVLQPGGPTVITVGDTLGYTVDVTDVAAIDFPWTADD